jgi:hypothetical protein
MSFFGGNLAYSHWTVDIKYKAHPDESYGEQHERRRAERAKLKAAGFKTPYFQYRNKDTKAKAECERKARQFAKLWTKKTGVTLEVFNGCFL